MSYVDIKIIILFYKHEHSPFITYNSISYYVAILVFFKLLDS